MAGKGLDGPVLLPARATTTRGVPSVVRPGRGIRLTPMAESWSCRRRSLDLSGTRQAYCDGRSGLHEQAFANGFKSSPLSPRPAGKALRDHRPNAALRSVVSGQCDDVGAWRPEIRPGPWERIIR